MNWTNFLEQIVHVVSGGAAGDLLKIIAQMISHTNKRVHRGLAAQIARNDFGRHGSRERNRKSRILSGVTFIHTGRHGIVLTRLLQWGKPLHPLGDQEVFIISCVTCVCSPSVPLWQGFCITEPGFKPTIF